MPRGLDSIYDKVMRQINVVDDTEHFKRVLSIMVMLTAHSTYLSW